jgi:HEAT repeat protein
LGKRLLDKDSRVAEEAERALSLIDDPAVIPWYIRALDSNRYHMKFRAIDQLGRFDSDEAFDALKKSLTTQPSDFGDTASPSVAPDLVHNIRVAAVQRLSRCPHRDAKKYVLSLWNDPDPSVRIDVLHLLGKMGTPEALQLLKKMSTDGNELVRSEAARYLKLQSE